MFVLKLTLDYFMKNKLKVILYFLIIAFTYPFESLVISKNISRLSQAIPKFNKLQNSSSKGGIGKLNIGAINLT